MKIQLKKTSIAYDDVGQGMPILFIHGYPLNRSMWQPQLSGLKDIARVLSMDLRGHGESEQVAGPYSMELFADDCMEFLDSLHINQKIILCGLSMGGYISMAFYRKYAQHLAGLILTATRAGADSPEARNNRDKAIAQTVENGPGPIIQGMLGKLLSPSTFSERPGLVQDTRQIMESISAETIIADLQALKERPDSTSILPTIREPVCIIHGADDQIIPLTEAQAMKNVIPDARLHVLEKAGHLLNLEQPESFNQAVQQFLNEIKDR